MAVVQPELFAIAQEARRRFAPSETAVTAGIREWLRAGGSYYVSSSTANSIVFDAVDESWAFSNGADADRFFWAARESVIPRSASCYDARSIAWASVSAYYCSFYVVMGFLRAFGNGYIYLGADDVAILNAALSPVRLEAGVYGMTVTLGAPTQVELRKQRVRGVHEGFWRYADNCLITIAQDVSTGSGAARPFAPIARSAALLSIEDLRKWLGEPGKLSREVGWMSALRNEINYQFRRKAWPPTFQDGSVTVDRLRSDVQAIVRGTRSEIGRGLRIDPDIKALVERASVLFRELGPLTPMPALS